MRVQLSLSLLIDNTCLIAFLSYYITMYVFVHIVYTIYILLFIIITESYNYISPENAYFIRVEIRFMNNNDGYVAFLSSILIGIIKFNEY